MINLIPKEEKKKMIADFRIRFAILVLIMLDFCLFVVCVSLAPSYFAASIKASFISAELETQKSEPLPLLEKQSVAAAADINAKIRLVERAEKDAYPISTNVVNAVLTRKGPGIKLTRISYDADPAQGEKGKKISITGIAPSREALLLFRQSLEDSPAFKSVDLPISSFVKGSNIQFSINLILA